MSKSIELMDFGWEDFTDYVHLTIKVKNMGEVDKLKAQILVDHKIAKIIKDWIEEDNQLILNASYNELVHHRLIMFSDRVSTLIKLLKKQTE